MPPSGKLEPEPTPQASSFLTKLMEVSYNLIKRSNEQTSLTPKLQWDAFDLIDGLLFYSILDETSEVLLGHTTPASATRLSQKLKALSGVDCSSALEGLLHQLSSRRSEVSHKQFNVPMQPVLDFTHPALDKYFEDVKITSHTAAKQQNSEIFREATHWHNSKNTLSEIHCKALDESTK